MSKTLNEARMPSLADKLDAMEEVKKEEVVEEKVEKKVKKSKKSK